MASNTSIASRGISTKHRDGPRHFDHYAFDKHDGFDKGDKEANGPRHFDRYVFDKHDGFDKGSKDANGPPHKDEGPWHLHHEYKIAHWHPGHEEGHDAHHLDIPHIEPHHGFDQYVLHDERHGDPKWAHANWHGDAHQFEKFAFNHLHDSVQHSWQQHLPHWAAVDHDHHQGGPGEHHHGNSPATAGAPRH